MIIYGGTETRVRLQLECEHKWHGPCIDAISRYSKCTRCFALDRALQTERQYWDATEEAKKG